MSDKPSKKGKRGSLALPGEKFESKAKHESSI